MQNITAAIPPCVSITAHDGTVLCSWSDNPSFRGTLNILWLCTSTLGLCVWNAVHPDVPYPGTSKWLVRGKRVWWLFIGLIMPEILVITALDQFRCAYRLQVRVCRETQVPVEFPRWMRLIERWWPTPLTGKEIVPIRRVPSLRVEFPRCMRTIECWWPTPLTEKEVVTIRRVPSLQRSNRAPLPSSLDVELGDRIKLLPTRGSDPPRSGMPPLVELDDMIRLLHPDAPDPSVSVFPGTAEILDSAEGARRKRKHPWTLTHSFYAVMHGFLGADGDAFWMREADDDGRVSTILNPSTSMQHMSASLHASSIPDLSADDLDDRSKAGSIAKALLVWQFSVFIANCAARLNQTLPLSLLEITTLAHTLCSLIALGLWWYKPHSVSEATLIDRTGSLPSPPKVGWQERAATKVIPGGNIAPGAITIFFGIAALYGLPHLLGLSAHFPTSVEQLCWRLATFTVICSPLIIFAIGFIISCLFAMIGSPSRMQDATDTMWSFLFMTLLILYPIASMFLVGESVRQIFALPEGSFHEPQLTRYLPSFS